MNQRKQKRWHKQTNSWSASGNRQRMSGAKSRSSPSWPYAIAGLGLGGVIGLVIFLWPTASTPLAASQLSTSAAPVRPTFTLCHTGGGTNCVVDGDTIWMDGIKIRVADIDAPETHPSRCQSEADLGARATTRLLALVNGGPFEARPVGNRDQDQYGRKLRVLVRNGSSLGDMLVSEGLARTWTGRREPWC